MQDDEHDWSGEPNADGGGGTPAIPCADEMSDEDWMEAMLKLNPWAKDIDPNTYLGSFGGPLQEAARAASWARLEAGVEEWNEWAKQINLLRPLGNNRRTEIFGRLTQADFTNRSFPLPIRAFDGAIFPGRTHFDNSIHSGGASFNRTTFYDEVSFLRVRFLYNKEIATPTTFLGTRFKGRAYFQDVVFHGATGFVQSTFESAVYFNQATFMGRALFQQSTFFGETCFNGSAFHDDTYFSECRFLGATSFEQTIFERPASFASASFLGPASFHSAQSKTAFSLASAKFKRTPDFIEATFHEPPRLDDCVIKPTPAPYGMFADDPAQDPRPPSLVFDMYRGDFNVARDKDEHARLRKLRKMAADGKDHENELKFNGYEIAARRFWVDKPNELRFWLGWLYGLTSDYGQSVKRPLLIWLALAVAFWVIFLVFTPDHTKLAHGASCHEDYRRAVGQDAASLALTTPAWQALSLSLRNASIIAQPDASVTRRIYGCLYGFENPPPDPAKSDAGPKPSLMHPVIPTSVSYLSAIQSLLSAIFLFLLGLGLRNTFRMK